MSGLPKGWVEASLEDLVSAGGIVTDGDWVESKDQDPNGEVRLTQLADVGEAEFRDKSDRHLTAEKAEQLGCTFLEAGDVLIARMPDPLGRACIFPGLEQPAVTVVDVLIFRSGTDLVSPRWIMSAVNASQTRHKIIAQASGTTRQRISGGNLKRLPLPLPPLAEQKRIVAKLDALNAKSARARTELARIETLVSRYKQAVLSKAFSGELTREWRDLADHLNPVEPRSSHEVRSSYRLDRAQSFEAPYELPISWEWHTLPYLGDLDRGRSRHRPRNDPKLFDGPYPFIQTGDVRAAEQYVREHSQTYSDFGLKQSKLWPPETLCITIAANIAETALLSYSSCFPDSVVGFAADADKILPKYAEFFLRTAKERISQFAPATAQKNINLEILAAVRLPVAPLEEQHEIVRRIESAFAKIDRLAGQAKRALELVGKLDQAILAKAFRGELVPQDETDEPADRLLARIRAERQAAPKAKRGRRAQA